MFKLCLFVAIFAVAFALPAPKAEPKAEAKPDILLGYSSPVIAAPAVAYTSEYVAPLAYADYAAPLVYASSYAYPAAPYVVL